MKQVIVHSWCDAHILFDQANVEAETVCLNLGQGEKELELCGCQEHRSFAEMIRVYTELGRSPEQQVAAVPNPGPSKKRKVSSRKGKPLPKGEFPCRFCSRMLQNPQTQGMHEFRYHPWQRMLWEEETNYVENKIASGFKFDPRQLVTRRERLELLEQFGMTLKEIAEREKQNNPAPRHPRDNTVTAARNSLLVLSKVPV